MKRLLYIILLSILVSCASRKDSCVQYSDDTIFYKVVEIKSNDAWPWDVIYAKKEESSMIDIIFSFKPERVDGFVLILWKNAGEISLVSARFRTSLEIFGR